MYSSLITGALGLAIAFVGGLLAIIYQNLNNKTKENTCLIKDIGEKVDKVKDDYATKQDLKELKSDQSKTSDRLEKKLDRIIEMILEGRHEK